VINPGVVVGAPLDLHYGASVALIERILKARDPMLPKLGFPIVDVRDVAEMHVLALEQPDTIGKRFIAAERFLWVHEIAEILKAAHPDLGITTRCAPGFVIRLLALRDPSLRSILPMLGKRQDMTSARARSEMGIRFRDVAESITETGAFLVANRAL
jgi:dihydroflavonol-4-reductase